MTFTTETVGIAHIEQYATRERPNLKEHSLVGLIIGPYVPKPVQMTLKNVLFRGIALEEFRHNDPRLALVEGDPQNTYRGRQAGLSGMSLRALRKAYVADAPDRFYHINYIAVERGELIISVWDRIHAPHVRV